MGQIVTFQLLTYSYFSLKFYILGIIYSVFCTLLLYSWVVPEIIILYIYIKFYGCLQFMSCFEKIYNTELTLCTLGIMLHITSACLLRCNHKYYFYRWFNTPYNVIYCQCNFYILILKAQGGSRLTSYIYIHLFLFWTDSLVKVCLYGFIIDFHLQPLWLYLLPLGHYWHYDRVMVARVINHSGCSALLLLLLSLLNIILGYPAILVSCLLFGVFGVENIETQPSFNN